MQAQASSYTRKAPDRRVDSQVKRLIRNGRIGSKFAVGGAKKGIPVVGRRYDIYAMKPELKNNRFLVLCIDTEQRTAHLVDECYFDWSKPWFEKSPDDRGDAKTRKALEHFALGL